MEERREAYEADVFNLSTAIELEPDVWQAYQLRAVAYGHLGEYDKAIQDCTTAIAINKNSWQSYQTRGAAKSRLGQHAAAVEDCSAAIYLNPQSWEAYQTRGGAHAHLGAHDKAQKDCSAAIEINPRAWQAFQTRGAARSHLRDFANALKDSSTAIELNPYDWQAYVDRAGIYGSQGRYDLADKDASVAIALNGQVWQAFHTRAFIRRRLGQDERAVEDATLAIALFPDAWMAYDIRAAAYAKLGQRALQEQDVQTSAAIKARPRGTPAPARPTHTDAGRQGESTAAEQQRAAAAAAAAAAERARIEEEEARSATLKRLERHQQLLQQQLEQRMSSLGEPYAGEGGLSGDAAGAEKSDSRGAGSKSITPARSESPCGPHPGKSCAACRRQGAQLSDKLYHCQECSNVYLCDGCYRVEATVRGHSAFHSMRILSPASTPKEHHAPTTILTTATTASDARGGDAIITPATAGLLVPYDVLVLATDGFSEQNRINDGSGMFRGDLYGTPIAVKVLDTEDGGQRVFENELSLLTQFQHPNILSLNGSCATPSKLYLVYDHMAHGALDARLACEGGSVAIPVLTRLRIGVAICRGLLYLHVAGPMPIVHRDLKSSCILLDENWVARVSNFSVARLGDEASPVPMRSYSPGYVEPEFARTGRVIPASDVYALGVVLLELLTGRRPTGGRIDQVDLVTWVTDRRERPVTDIADQRAGTWPQAVAEGLRATALRCLAPRRERASLEAVLEQLQGVCDEAAAAQAASPEADPGAAGDAAPSNDCVVCYSAAVTSVLIPCGHCCLCLTCAWRVHVCPICRADVARVQQIA